MVQKFSVDCTGVDSIHSFAFKKIKIADTPELLFALEIFSDLEFIIDELMVDDDDIMHQSFETTRTPPPPNSGLSGGLAGFPP